MTKYPKNQTPDLSLIDPYHLRFIENIIYRRIQDKRVKLLWGFLLIYNPLYLDNSFKKVVQTTGEERVKV